MPHRHVSSPLALRRLDGRASITTIGDTRRPRELGIALLVRYGTSAGGKLVKKAEIYTAEDHHIDPALIDPDARRIIRRLRHEGFEAYIVGGAVRDLLTGLKPKDFDIATDARPRRVRRIFPRSRIIGRRFRIVHVYVQWRGEEKVFEVSTFRSLRGEGGENMYGSMEDDVWRRDFTLNALYYCPERQIIIDLVGGYRDIKERRLRTLAPTESSFVEDPVRMIRGVKYAEFTGFPLPRPITGAIRKHWQELSGCSPARLTEEAYKILGSGHSAGIFFQLFRLRLLDVFLPALEERWRGLSRRQIQDSLHPGLEALDQRVEREGSDSLDRGVMLAYLFRTLGAGAGPRGRAEQELEQLCERLRRWAQPLLPSRRELQRAARTLMRAGGRRSR
jgi:poly(A) polymerase